LPGDEGGAAGEQELSEAEQADAEDLAGEQPTGRYGREQQLDDA